jgi:hypothetical protein
MFLLERELEWIKVDTQRSPYPYQVFEEYVDSTKHYYKQVWNDGYEEVFELSGKTL